MRRSLIAVTLSLLVLATIAAAWNVIAWPASAQEATPDELELKHGANVMVTYLTDREKSGVIEKANYLGQRSDWFVISMRGNRTFIPTRNVLRIDVAHK